MTETEEQINNSNLSKRSIKESDKEFSSLIQEMKQRKRKGSDKKESPKKQTVETVVIEDF
jgi:hypothetical protein